MINYRQLFIIICICCSSIVLYGQKVDTTYYANGSIRMIVSSDSEKETFLVFNNEEGKNIIDQNTFEYVFFDTHFNAKRVIKFIDRSLFEDYWISNSDTIYNEIRLDSDFDKNSAAFLKHVLTNTIYPREARRKGIQGKVWVSFIVNKSGEITQLKAQTAYGAGLEEEAIRIVGLKKNFGIIRYNGKPVNMFMRLPVKFKLVG